MPYKRLDEAEIDRAVELYAADWSAERIGSALGVTGRAVLNALERRGVPRREPGFAGFDELARREVARVPRLRRALEALEAAGFEVAMRRRGDGGPGVNRKRH